MDLPNTSNDDNGIIQPGAIIRPILNLNGATNIFERLYGMRVLNITELNSYDDRNFKIEVEENSEKDNFSVNTKHGYVLKVLNSLDSQKEHFKAEIAALSLLNSKEINCPLPVKNKNGQFYNLERIEFSEGNETYSNYHIVRLLTFTPGITLYNVPYTKNIFYQVGEFIAQLTNAFNGWSHPALEGHQTVWLLENVPQIRTFLFSVASPEHRTLVEDVINEFETVVIPRLGELPKGVNHGDLNEQNILVQPSDINEPNDVSGILDFGDMNFGCVVFDIAINIMYMMLESKSVDYLDVGGHILAGYLKLRKLSLVEWSVLKTCVAARFAQSLVMGAYSYSQDPSNEYLLITAKQGWSILELFQKECSESIITRWRRIASSVDA